MFPLRSHAGERIRRFTMAMWKSRYGPDKPSPLLRIDELRTGAMARAWCAMCRKAGPLSAATLDGMRSQTLGEVWIRGEVRCPVCGKAATALMARPTWDLGRYEPWSPDEPLNAWRLRHHWRWRDD